MALGTKMAVLVFLINATASAGMEIWRNNDNNPVLPINKPKIHE
jgi:hypothetical protein